MSRLAAILRAGTAFATMLAATPAHADTDLMGGPPYTDANPRGLISGLARDPNGLSSFSNIGRTPTGLLYPPPFLYPEMNQSKTDSDWWSSGWLEVGFLGTFGDTRSAQFNAYRDWNIGPLVSGAGFLTENRETAFYFSGRTENVGRDDQFYQLDAGRYGAFNVSLFFDGTPHLLSTRAKSLWDGAGTDNLALRGGLVPGASTSTQINAVLASTATSDLKVTREKAGVAFSYMFNDVWEGVLRLSNEWRDGMQPLGATFGYPFQNGANQIVKPVRYTTLDVTAALRYSAEQSQANLIYSGSIFRNELQSVTWQNPGLRSLTPPASYNPSIGRISLPPSNQYHSLKADVAKTWGPNVRFAGSVAYSIMRQNDSLIPPTVSTGVIQGVATTIDLSRWNTTAALSRQTADASIDTFRAFAQLQYTPMPDLTLNFTVNANDERNNTNYVAFNPSTGQYGYIAIDGGLASFIPRLSGVYEPSVPGSLVQIRNIPFANSNLKLSADAAYRLSSRMKFDLSYTHNDTRHTAREVPDASDDRVKLQFVSNGNSWGTVRASYEIASRSGSDYVSNPYTPYYSSSLPGYIPRAAGGDLPFTLSDLRKFDVGDRTEHKLHIQSNFIVSPKADLQLSGDVRADDYDAEYGLKSATRFNAGTAFAYQLSPNTNVNIFYNLSSQNRDIANINTVGGATGGTAGSPAYPLANAWTENSRELDSTIGATLHHGFNSVSLDLNYTFTAANSALRYTYASTGAFSNSLTAVQAGTEFPDITFEYHALETNLRWQHSDTLAVRLYYRFDYQDLQDFHYAGLAPGVFSNNTFLGVVPENYTTHVLGTFLQFTF